MVWRALKITKTTWYIGLGLIVGLAVAYYFFPVQGAKKTVENELLLKQQTIAQAQAANIASSFQNFGSAVSALSKLPSVEAQDETTVEVMEALLAQQRERGLVSGVVITDKDGIVLFNSTTSGDPDTGADLSDRDYFVWARERRAQEGNYFIGRPVISRLGASKDQVIVPVGSPIYADEEFHGMVVAAVPLEPLTTRYANLMHISDQTKIYLIDFKQELIYSSSSEELDLSYFADFDTTGEGHFSAGGNLIAYSPIVLGDQNWVFVVVSPDTEVVEVAKGQVSRLFLMFLLTAISIIFYGVVITRQKQPQPPQEDQERTSST